MSGAPKKRAPRAPFEPDLTQMGTMRKHKKTRVNLDLRGIVVGGSGGIRTHVPLRTTAFRVQLVTTTSIRFLV